MSGYFAISLKKQQKSKYNLCKHQFRGNLKIKNQSISPKRLVGIESNVSHHVLLNFLDYKPLSELLKNFSCITLERRWRVYRKWGKTWTTLWRLVHNCMVHLFMLILFFLYEKKTEFFLALIWQDLKYIIRMVHCSRFY